MLEWAAHSFRGTCMKANQKHAVTSDATLAEIRRMALAGAAFLMSRWCKARVCEILFSGHINFLLQSPLYWGYPSISVKVEIS